MKLGISGRLALVFGVLVAVVALVVGSISIISAGSEINNDVDRFLKSRADDISSGIRQRPAQRINRRGTRPNPDDGRTNADAPLSGEVSAPNTAVDADAVVQVIDVDGTVATGSGIELPVEDEDLAVLEMPGSSIYRTVEINGESYRMYTTFINGGALQVARNIESTSAVLGSIRTRTIFFAVVLSVLAAVIGWLIARSVTKPLRQLTSSVDSVAATQDLNTTVAFTDRDDEIGRLANGFDDMLGALRTSRKQQHQLVENAAHEMRTPLTSVQANVDFLARANDVDETTRQEMLSRASAQLRELNSVFTEIVELATDSRDPATYEIADLADIAQSACARFEMRATVPVELQSTPCLVHVEPASIERAIGNLLDNAAKYGGNTPITVVVNNGQLSVRDRGPGLGDADLTRVFDRFYRADSTGDKPGSGLGLAIVSKIVTDHGGQAIAENHPDGGARIGFVLPTVTV